MKTRMHGAQSDLLPENGKLHFDKYIKHRTVIRKIFSSLGTDFSKMASGKQLYNVYSEYIASIFVDVHVSLQRLIVQLLMNSS